MGTRYVKKTKPALWYQIQNPESGTQLRRSRPRAGKPAGTANFSGKRVWRTIARSKTSSKLKARRQLSPLSNRQRERLKRYAISKRQWWREVRGKVCPVMLVIERRSVPVLDKPHHMRGRLGDLLWDVRFFLAVSQQGHDWIHQNIEQARRHGWIAQAGDWGSHYEKNCN